MVNTVGKDMATGQDSDDERDSNLSVLRWKRRDSDKPP